MYAVRIEPLHAIAFVGERPDESEWEIQEGVQVDIPSNYDDWPEGTAAPQHILCVSTKDASQFKVFRHPKDINRAEYRPTEMNFGGVFSKSSWERFARRLTELRQVQDTEPEEPPGATDAAIRALTKGR